MSTEGKVSAYFEYKWLVYDLPLSDTNTSRIETMSPRFPNCTPRHPVLWDILNFWERYSNILSDTTCTSSLMSFSFRVRVHCIPSHNAILAEFRGHCHKKQLSLKSIWYRKWEWQHPIWFQGLKICAVPNRHIHPVYKYLRLFRTNIKVLFFPIYD